MWSHRGWGKKADILRSYNQASLQLSDNPDDSKLADEVDRLQSELDETDGWSSGSPGCFHY